MKFGSDLRIYSAKRFRSSGVRVGMVASIRCSVAVISSPVVAQSCSWNAGGEVVLTNMVLLVGGSQGAGASGIQRRAGQCFGHGSRVTKLRIYREGWVSDFALCFE